MRGFINCGFSKELGDIVFSSIGTSTGNTASRDITRLCDHDSVFLNSLYRALIRLEAPPDNQSKTKLHFIARGLKPDNLLDILVGVVQQLVERWYPGLSYESKIFCPNCAADFEQSCVFDVDQQVSNITISLFCLKVGLLVLSEPSNQRKVKRASASPAAFRKFVPVAQHSISFDSFSTGNSCNRRSNHRDRGDNGVGM